MKLNPAIIAFIAPVLLYGCASSIPECDEAIRLREQAQTTTGDQRLSLEAKAASMESLCAQKRNESFEQQKMDTERKYGR